MPVPSSPKLSDLVTEFGGPGNLKAYYKGGTYVPNTPTNAAVSTDPNSLKLSQFAGAAKVTFSPTTVIRSTGSGTETAPAGATNVVIGAWGGGHAGASTGRWDTGGANGGDSGGYVQSSYSITGGQTLNYSVGSEGYYSGTSVITPTASTVTSGTKTITSISAGTTVSGGNQENTSGNAGQPSYGFIGGNGGAAISRVIGGVARAAGEGGMGADGNDPTPGPLFTPGGSGQPGLIVFYYT